MQSNIDQELSYNFLKKSITDVNNKLEDIEIDGLYRVEVLSSKGNIFLNGNIDTILTAKLYRGSIDITLQTPMKCFKWKRISEDLVGDEVWNAQEHIGYSISITTNDVLRKATFEVNVEEAIEFYKRNLRKKLLK